MTKARNAQSVFLPIPINGVDFRAPIFSMPQELCPIMVNFHVQNGKLVKRFGHSRILKLANTSAGDCIIIPYNTGTATVVISVGTTKTEFTTSSTTSNTPAEIAPPFYDWTIFANTILVAGNAVVYQLNPTTLAWTSGLTFTAGSATTTRKPICHYRERVYVGDKFKLWYGGVGSISGAMTSFDLTNLVSGAGIIAIGSLAFNNNNFLDQLLVLVSNLGEVLIYSGSYPGGTDWQLVNRFIIPVPPANISCPVEIIEVANDLLINIKYGYLIVSVRDLLTKGSLAISESFSDVLRPLDENMVPLSAAAPTFKTAAYIKKTNSLVIFWAQANNSNRILDYWGTFWDIAGGPQGFIAKISLKDGSLEIHNCPPLVDFLNVSSQMRASASSAYIVSNADASNGGIAKLFDEDVTTGGVYQDNDFTTSATTLVDYNAICPFVISNEFGFRNKAIKNLLLISNLMSGHTISHAINKSFDLTLPTFATFSTANATDVVHPTVLPGSSVGQAHIVFLKHSASSIGTPFEIYGINTLYEEGGEY